MYRHRRDDRTVRTWSSVVACLGLLLAATFLCTSEASEWQRFRGASFTLEHPTGWQVEAEELQGSINLRGSAGEQITLWPIFVRRELTHDLAQEIARQLATRAAPTFPWKDPSNVGAQAVKLTGLDDTGNVAVASLSWVVTKQGTAATFVCVSAPSSTFDRAEDLFAEVLASLRLIGPSDGSPGAEPATELPFERWRDPKEDAFEVEIPQNWQVHGGLARAGESDTRFAVEVRPPDGRQRVYLGSADTPIFVVPSTSLEGAGFVEGSWYVPPRGTRMQVRRSMSGAQFARWFATTTVAREMTGLSFSAVRNRPDVDRELSMILRRAGLPAADQQIIAGEAQYTCRDKQGLLEGYAFAATLAQPLPRGNGEQWTVQQNFGYLSPADGSAMARSVLWRLVTSFRLNPDWVVKQKHLPAHVMETSAQSTARLAEMLSHVGDHRDETLSREERLRETKNVVLELSNAIDPASGKPLRVESGASYYWLDSRGNVVGTDRFSVPNVDPRQLVRRKP